MLDHFRRQPARGPYAMRHRLGVTLTRESHRARRTPVADLDAYLSRGQLLHEEVVRLHVRSLASGSVGCENDGMMVARIVWVDL